LYYFDKNILQQLECWFSAPLGAFLRYNGEIGSSFKG